MASRSTIRVTERGIAVAFLAWLVLGCMSSSSATPGGTEPAKATQAATSRPDPPGSRPADGGPSATLPGLDAPPDALLGAEGGDPVQGQLGTYLWLDTGSDSPWLPGSPLTVGTGEPLTLSLDPGGDIRAWSARYVPAGATGAQGAIALGEGNGVPTFHAPGPGHWTVEVAVEFAAGVGDARYFWRLEVE
jgi:hypothetical protein